MYQAKKRGATAGDLKTIQAIYAKAAKYQRWIKVCVDHIIPISKGGAHIADNLQIIYASENLAKNCSLNYKPRVIFL